MPGTLEMASRSNCWLDSHCVLPDLQLEVWGGGVCRTQHSDCTVSNPSSGAQHSMEAQLTA
jgi:hypothetical protein